MAARLLSKQALLQRWQALQQHVAAQRNAVQHTPRIQAFGGRLGTAWRRLAAWRWQWLVALPAAGGLYVLLLIPFTPSISDIRKAKLEQPAQVLTADGKELAVFKRSNRQWVTLDQVAPAVVQALIATEDHRFYAHHGMDWRRTLSSAFYSLQGDLQGGSTLTQQLARNLYPEEIGRAASLNRKLKEAITAFKIEALYSKDEILETYLNTVPFLYNAWGIEMAARTYFDKPAAKLSVIESATLVGMLKGTSYYNPVRNPERAVARRNTVLSQMVKREVLAADEFERLKKRPLRLNFERQEVPTGMAPHFAQQVRKWLIDWADSEGYTSIPMGWWCTPRWMHACKHRPIRPCATTREPCRPLRRPTGTSAMAGARTTLWCRAWCVRVRPTWPCAKKGKVSKPLCRRCCKTRP